MPSRTAWRRRLQALVLLAGASAFGAAPAFARSDCADVALVLAIDGSASIDADEFDLQKRGYHGALTDPRIMDVFAIAGVVDIAAVFWADSGFRPQIIPFQRITSPRQAADFADTLMALDRKISGNTDLAKGISSAVDLLENSGRCADRVVIDVSSDGRASVSTRLTPSGNLAAVRTRASDLGIVINALVIKGKDDKLADYYREHVAVGIQSFVMEVSSFASFNEAIANKLMRELLSGLPGDLTCTQRAARTGQPDLACRRSGSFTPA